MNEIGPIGKVTIHHSASSVMSTFEDVKSWHLDRGFDDIGYHFIIPFYGQVMKGRSLEFEGAHVLGKNRGNIGICVIGNNTEEKNCWSPVQIKSLVNLIYALRMVYQNIELCSHRSLDENTECPGIPINCVMHLCAEIKNGNFKL